MIISVNLLPPSKKKALKQSFYAKMLLRHWFWIFLMSLLCVIMMASLLVVVRLQGQGMEDANKQGNQEAHSELTRYQETFTQANKEIRAVSGYYAKHASFIGLLNQISEKLPDGVRIEKLVFEDGKLQMTGVAERRDQLLLLQSRLEEDKECFHDIDMPLSNIFSETNARFEIDFSVESSCIQAHYE